MKKLICKLLDHSWKYSFTMDSPRRLFRTCKCCHISQEHKLFLANKSKDWVTMVSYSDKFTKIHKDELDKGKMIWLLIYMMENIQ